VPVTTTKPSIPPHCPPVPFRGGKGYRTEDDDVVVGSHSGKGGGTYKKQRRVDSSDRTMEKFDRHRRGLTAHGNGNMSTHECPEYVDSRHDAIDNDDDDDDDDEGKGRSSFRTDSGSYRSKAGSVMKKDRKKKSGMTMYRLDDDHYSGSKGKGMSM
jgi:hypothetical protein